MDLIFGLIIFFVIKSIFKADKGSPKKSTTSRNRTGSGDSGSFLEKLAAQIAEAEKANRDAAARKKNENFGDAKPPAPLRPQSERVTALSGRNSKKSRYSSSMEDDEFGSSEHFFDEETSSFETDRGYDEESSFSDSHSGYDEESSFNWQGDEAVEDADDFKLYKQKASHVSGKLGFNKHEYEALKKVKNKRTFRKWNDPRLKNKRSGVLWDLFPAGFGAKEIRQGIILKEILTRPNFSKGSRRK